MPHRFIKNIVALVTGTASAQLIMLLALPFITRLYTPGDFGLFAIFLSVLGMASIVSTLRYELAIPLTATVKDASAVVFLSLFLAGGVSFIIFTGLYFSWGNLEEILGADLESPVMWMLPLGVFLAGALNVVSHVLIRNKSFSLLATGRVVRSSLTVFVQMVGYLLGAITLMGGRVLGDFVSSVLFMVLGVFRGGLVRVSFRDIARVAKRYKNFPKYSTWAGFFGAAGTEAPPLLIAMLLGSVTTGLFALAYRVLTMPMTIVGQAVASVFFSEGAERYKSGRLGELVISLHQQLLKLIIPVVAVLVVVSPELFSFVFGKEWVDSGSMASWLSLLVLFMFSISPVSHVFSIIERQAIGFYLQVLMLFLKVGAIVIASFFGDVMDVVAAYSLSGSAGYIIYGLTVFHFCGIPARMFFGDIVRIFPAAIIFMLIPHQLLSVWNVGIFIWAPAILLCFSFYYYYSFSHEIIRIYKGKGEADE